MWICPLCNQQFIKNNQSHYCGEKELADHLQNKTPHAVALFHHFVKRFREIGPVTVHPTKSMIAFAADKRMAYLTRIGKEFIDISFPFDKPYPDNLCFQKIAQVPGTEQYNHHFRMCLKEDVNKEVMSFMKLAYNKAKAT